ncbi:MAG: PKD domain-containing protein [Tenuifilaceae bacterium]
MKTTIFFLSSLILLASCNKEQDYRKLKAEFAIGDTLLMVGEFLDIKNMSDSTNVIYNWDFGDRFSSDIRKPIHYYTTPGVYNIQLKVSDNFGNVESIAHKIRVGERYIYEIEIVTLNEHKYFSTADYWDQDSIGINALPDVYFVITGYNNNTSLYETKTIFNVSQTNLPIIFQIPNIKIQPFNDYEIGLNSFGLYLRDRDKSDSEDMTSNKMSGTSGSSYIYNKTGHTGEFTIGFSSSFRVKFKIK